MELPINNFSYSTVNGPGYRFVIWVQGCKLNCKGCFNPETHPYNVGFSESLEKIASDINNSHLIEGITISGGEPFDYAKELLHLFTLTNTSLTKIIFTGYTIKEILGDPMKANLTKNVDLVLAGRYNKKLVHPFLGKKLINVTGKVDLSFFLPRTLIEYSFNRTNVTKTGIF